MADLFRKNGAALGRWNGFATRCATRVCRDMHYLPLPPAPFPAHAGTGKDWLRASLCVWQRQSDMFEHNSGVWGPQPPTGLGGAQTKKSPVPACGEGGRGKGQVLHTSTNPGTAPRLADRLISPGSAGRPRNASNIQDIPRRGTSTCPACRTASRRRVR